MVVLYRGNREKNEKPPNTRDYTVPHLPALPEIKSTFCTKRHAIELKVVLNSNNTISATFNYIITCENLFWIFVKILIL